MSNPRAVRILPRGNWMDDSGEVVLPQTPGFLGEIPSDERLTRLDLANWLLATGLGTPIGLLAGIYLAEFDGPRTREVAVVPIWTR